MSMAPAAKILIVEDDRDTRGALRDVLAQEGYQPVAVADLKAAERCLDKHGAPALALIDFTLPDGIGTTLARSLRSVGIPALMMSAYPTWLRESLHPDPDWFAKPLDLTRLLLSIRELVELGPQALERPRLSPRRVRGRTA